MRSKMLNKYRGLSRQGNELLHCSCSCLDWCFYKSPDLRYIIVLSQVFVSVAVHRRSAESRPDDYDGSLFGLSGALQPLQRTWTRWGHMVRGVKVSGWPAGGRSSPQSRCQIANISVSAGLLGFTPCLSGCHAPVWEHMCLLGGGGDSDAL